MKIKLLAAVFLAVLICTGCRPRQADAQALASLRKVDPYPLYSMAYHGDIATDPVDLPASASPARWSCALFAALGDPRSAVYGRNFDWQYSPALLLFVYPTEGYASVSMVDLAYLADEDDFQRLDRLPTSQRRYLLQAVQMPFDGMNEAGLAIGMAAVPAARAPDSPGLAPIDSLTVMREVLDHAGDVNEAVSILGKYRIQWGSGPPLHYLVADASGSAALVEFLDGEMVVIPNTQPWHLATNFTLTGQASAAGNCPRYDRIQAKLESTEGALSPQQALELLATTAQKITQWSVVYDLSQLQVQVVMGQQMERVHTFKLAKTQSLSPTAFERGFGLRLPRRQ